MGLSRHQSDMLTSQDAILRRGDVSNRRTPDIADHNDLRRVRYVEILMVA
jgi:hypothetical protein